MTGDLNITFGHRLIYNCGEAATTTLNPEPQTLNPWNLQNFFRPVSMVEANRQLLFLYDEFIIMNTFLCQILIHACAHVLKA